MPTGTPREVIRQLNTEINRVVQLPLIRERFASLGAEPMNGSPEQWIAYVREEVSKWAEVIKAAGVRLD